MRWKDPPSEQFFKFFAWSIWKCHSCESYFWLEYGWKNRIRNILCTVCMVKQKLEGKPVEPQQSTIHPWDVSPVNPLHQQQLNPLYNQLSQSTTRLSY